MHRRRFKTFACVVGLALSFTGGAAQAATVIFSGQTASEVDDLVVDGIAYDVTFSSFGSGPGATTFDGNPAGALDAATALDAALNATPAAYVAESGVGVINQFIVQDDGLGSGVGTSSFFAAGNWQITGLNITNDGSTAVFTAALSETPLPAALPLFAGGLGALGLLGWRRRRQVLTTA